MSNGLNLWKDVAPGKADSINTIIEINKGSKNKYEVDKETGLIALDRVSYTTQDFPVDYGFVPQTLWDDGDPLDVIVLTTNPFFPGLLVKVRPVGIMDMIDSGDSDAKLLTVPVDDPRWNEVQDLKDINKHTLKEIEHFYSTYKKLQNKEVKVLGFGDKNKAVEAFEKSLKLYKEKFGN